MKEIYFENTDNLPIELDRGTIEGIGYKIITHGSHPCCYLIIPKDHILFEVSYDDIDLSVHGGLTYGEEENGEWVIGWDYAHAGDLYHHKCLHDFTRDVKEWTLKELKVSVIDAIKQIKKLKKFQVKKYYYATEESDWR